MATSDRRTAIFLSYATLAVTISMSILFTPIIIRLIGPSEHGLYSIVNTIVSYFTVLDLGVGSAVVRYTAKYRVDGDTESQYRMYGLFLLFFSVVGLIALIGSSLIAIQSDTIFANSLTGDQQSRIPALMLIAAVNLAITFPATLFSSIIGGFERFTFLKGLDLLNALLTPLLMVAAVFVGKGVLGMLVVIVFVNAAVGLSRMFFCFRSLKIRISFRRLDLRLVKEVLSYSVFVFLAQIADKLFWATDSVVLGIVADSAIRVSIYAYGFSFAAMFISLTSVIGQLYLPQFTRMLTQDHFESAISDQFVRVSRLQFFLSSYVYLGFALVGLPLIIFLVGSEYINSYYVALLIMTGLIPGISQNVGVSVLQARNLHHFRAYLQLGMAVVNVVLTVILARRYAELGAAVATTFTQLFGVFLVMSIYYQKRAKLNVTGLWSGLAPHLWYSGVSLAAGFGTRELSDAVLGDVSSMFVTAAVFSVIYWSLTYRFSMNGNERPVIGSIVSSIVKGLKQHD